MDLYGVPVECINHAAIEYSIPAIVIVSVLRTERGKVGSANINRNGTIDYGPMQINSTWLKKLSQYGYTQKHLQNDACSNVEIGTWILAQNIADGKNLWNGIGGYHSHTPKLNYSYSLKIKNTYEVLSSL